MSRKYVVTCYNYIYHSHKGNATRPFIVTESHSNGLQL